MIPGEIAFGDGLIEINAARAVIAMEVLNTGDRPIQVGSHYHFADANDALRFDRDVAQGMRLNVPAGTAVRFEPGIPRNIELVPLGGAHFVAGLRL